jgi:hypothetical protein
MASDVAVVLIKRPARVDPADFDDQLVKKVLSAVHKGPTRVGSIDGWDLLRRDNPVGDHPAGSHHYVWVVRWSGLRQTPEVLLRGAFKKLEALGAKVTAASYGRLHQAPDA